MYYPHFPENMESLRLNKLSRVIELARQTGTRFHGLSQICAVIENHAAGIGKADWLTQGIAVEKGTGRDSAFGELSPLGLKIQWKLVVCSSDRGLGILFPRLSEWVTPC